MNAVVSLFFYIKVLKYMFLMKPEEGNTQKLKFGAGAYIVMFALVIPTMVFGIILLRSLDLPNIRFQCSASDKI